LALDDQGAVSETDIDLGKINAREIGRNDELQLVFQNVHGGKPSLGDRIRFIGSVFERILYESEGKGEIVPGIER